MLRRKRKLLPKLFSFALLLTMILTIGPLNAFAATTTPQRINEITDLRTENSRTYLLDNGQYQVDVYASDIYFRDSKDSLQEISNKLVVADSESGYKYTNEANSWHSSFKDDLSSKDAVSIGQGDYSVSFNILETKAKTTAVLSDTLKSSESELDRTYADDNRVVMYKGVFTSTDIAYTTFNSCLKEDIILRDNTAPSEFSFDVSLKGLTLSEDSDGVCFINGRGDVVFRMMPLYMQDSKGKSSESVKYTLVKTAEGYQITISADKSFLNDPSTVFPVVIDPSYDTKGSSYTSDTFVSSSNPSQNYYMDYYERTGRTSSYGIRRSYIRFKLPSGYRVGSGDGDGITEASLKLKLYQKGSGDLHTRAYLVDRYWRSDELTYSEADEMNWQTISDLAQLVDGWWTIDVFSPINAIYNQYVYMDNYGFEIRDDYENDTNIYANYYSSDCGTSSYVPVLSITYEDITSYQHFGGAWLPSDVSDDLTLYVESGANSQFGTAINSVWNLWNGIDADLNIDSKSTSGNPNTFKIVVANSSDLEDDELGYTEFLDVNHNVVFENNPNNSSWHYVKIYLNANTGQLSSQHLDIQKEVILHELGHAIGLAHVNALNYNSSVCIMEQRNYYCYPSPTSHDKNTLKDKYN
jgi:hypothetical protein